MSSGSQDKINSLKIWQVFEMQLSGVFRSWQILASYIMSYFLSSFDFSNSLFCRMSSKRKIKCNS